MNKKIVIINGSGGVGKNTFSNLCSNYIPILDISSVDQIKKAAKILGWDNDKSEHGRKFLSDLKFLSTNYNNNPYEYIKQRINWYKQGNKPSILFIHIREPEEIKKVKADFNCKTLLIKNSNVEDITSNEADGRVYYYTYDYIIDNSGSLDDLEKKAHEFIKCIFGEDKHE